MLADILLTEFIDLTQQSWTSKMARFAMNCIGSHDEKDDLQQEY